MKIFEQQIIKIFFYSIAILFVFFTFYGLDWGKPFYFHPDERNIASSVSQLSFPNQLNPHFFAYGSLPIYLVHAVGIFLNFIEHQPTLSPVVTFDQAIILGRLISALLTLASCVLVYKVTRLLSGQKTATLSAIFFMTSVAFLQFSHFGTFEVWLSFLSLLTAYFFILYLPAGRKLYFAIASGLIGLLTAIKLSSIVLLVIPSYLILLQQASYKFSGRKIVDGLRLVFIFLYFSIFLYVITAPFNILDSSSFSNSMKYEREVAMGTLKVFYTGSFYDKLPIIFQYEKVLPFLINPILTLLSIPAFFYCVFRFIKKRDLGLGIIILFFLSLFVSSSVLYVKWTRYLVPSIPFLYIMVAIFLGRLFQKAKPLKFTLVIITIGIICSIFAYSFLKTVRINQDTRIASRDFAVNTIPSEAKILSEVYDMGIVPFNDNFHQITLFNFYDLDNDPAKINELPDALSNSEYIILPSQRIYKSRILDPQHFPNGYDFYKKLFEGSLGFEKIYETPCDIFCKITYAGNPVFNVEETANVFDRPNIFIFKRK